MKSTTYSLVTLLPLLSLVSAVPSRLQRRQADTTQYCGQWDTATEGDNYELANDQWGISGATGSQCAQVTSLSGDDIAWTTTWEWSGGSGVKSFTDIQLNTGVNVQLSTISSMQSTWAWSYNLSSGSVADVAYDLFTADTAGGTNVNEIMVWLANYNAGPISSAYGSDGTPTPVKSDITIAGLSWNLYSGSNGANQVYSFLPSDSSDITSFSGDIMEFFTYLIENEGVSSSQYLKTVQAGTEPTSGSGTLTTSKYSISISNSSSASASGTSASTSVASISTSVTLTSTSATSTSTSRRSC